MVLSSCFSLLQCFLLFPIPMTALALPRLSLTPLASNLYVCVCIGTRSITARRTSVALSPLWCFLSCQFAVVLFSCFRAGNLGYKPYSSVQFSLLWCFLLFQFAVLLLSCFSLLWPISLVSNCCGIFLVFRFAVVVFSCFSLLWCFSLLSVCCASLPATQAHSLTTS